jgi:hypothetical protein
MYKLYSNFFKGKKKIRCSKCFPLAQSIDKWNQFQLRPFILEKNVMPCFPGLNSYCESRPQHALTVDSPEECPKGATIIHPEVVPGALGRPLPPPSAENLFPGETACGWM